MKLVLIVMLFATVAQIVPSCDGGESKEIIGWVEEKFDRTPQYIIVINHVDYKVPFSFWHSVQVGDLVKWDGLVWTIVKKAEMPPRHHV